MDHTLEPPKLEQNRSFPPEKPNVLVSCQNNRKLNTHTVRKHDCRLGRDNRLALGNDVEGP